MTYLIRFGLIFILIFSVNKIESEGSNILFFHTIGTSSHRTSIWPLAEELAERGHNVTYIFPASKEKRVGRHRKIEEITPSLMTPIVDHFVGDFDINYRLNNTVNEWTWRLLPKCLELCEAFYDSPETKEWISRPGLTYDLILIDQSFGECAFGLVYKFQAKFILFTPVLPMFMLDGVGVVPETGSIPEFFFHVKPREMNFMGRFWTTSITLLWRLAFMDYLSKIGSIVAEKMNVSDFPGITEFEKNTSLIMMNGHFVEEYPMSLPPMFVSYSGLWCSKAKLKATKPLPQKLESFIGNSDGFIYVSLGSAVIASGMPIELRDKFFNAFASFPNIKFFWRWTGEVPKNTPKNVLLMPWFPQHDILAHPNIKAFITQAGRPSSQEALCFGVPMITFPIFVDQDRNADRLEYLGVSLSLDINGSTESSLRDSIKEILSNSSYAEKTKELSAIFRDRPLDPLDNAVYWTEYVLRHDTSIMKPLGVNQTWWQRRLLDVYAALFVIVVVIILLTVLFSYALLLCLGKLIFKRKKKTD